MGGSSLFSILHFWGSAVSGPTVDTQKVLTQHALLSYYKKMFHQ